MYQLDFNCGASKVLVIRCKTNFQVFLLLRLLYNGRVEAVQRVAREKQRVTFSKQW